MSINAAVETVPSAATMPMPNFLSMVQAELFKITHQRAIWITGIVTAAVMCLNGLPYAFIVYGATQSGGESIIQPETITYTLMQQLLSIVRGYTGIFVMILAVMVIALEYQQGTIRVLLARGVGRMRLLGAKLAAIGVTGVMALVIALALSGIIFLADIQLGSGSLSIASHVPAYFWSDALVYVVTVLISIVATSLFAAMFAVVGRSLAFGLSLTLPYFLIVEAIISGLLTIVAIATTNTVWTEIPNYFLGVNLTSMPDLLIPARGFDLLRGVRGGVGANVPFDGTHALVVTAAYCVVFAAISFYLTYKRDVLQ